MAVITPTYKQGDQILLNGNQVTVLSWPALNAGPFMYERYVTTNTSPHFIRASAYVELNTIVTSALTAPAFHNVDFCNNKNAIDPYVGYAGA